MNKELLKKELENLIQNDDVVIIVNYNNDVIIKSRYEKFDNILSYLILGK